MTRTDARKRANDKYNKKAYEQIMLRFRKDREPTRESVARMAAELDMSINGFIIQAIQEKIERTKK